MAPELVRLRGAKAGANPVAGFRQGLHVSEEREGGGWRRLRDDRDYD
jgi:hypothetical protein